MTYKVMDDGVLRNATPDEIAEIEERVPEVVVPNIVSRRQARQALLLNGYLDGIDDRIAAIADPMQRRMAQIEWQDATDFDRNNPLLLQMALNLGLDAAGLDALFIQAGAL